MTSAVLFPLEADMVSWNPDVALSRLDDDSQLLASVIELMRSVLIRDQSALSQCIEARDFMDIRQLTHAQLPSLKILGFDASAQVFEVFESMALMSDWHACERMLPSIEKIWTDIVEALEQRLQIQG